MVNQTIENIYESYLEELQKAVSSEVRRFGGIGRLLTGKRSETENVVDAFDSKLQSELERIIGERADSAELRELAQWMLRQCINFRDIQQAKYAFMAALRHITPFVNCLEREDALYLTEIFEKAFPQRERFPVHSELISKLKERSRAKEAEEIK